MKCDVYDAHDVLMYSDSSVEIYIKHCTREVIYELRCNQ
jgi:hypothetical protein